MKITIDTKEDSHEEIRKIIKMLSSLVEGGTFTNQGNVFEKQDSDLGNQNVFNMFGSPSQPAKSEEAPEEPKEEIDIGIPRVEEYR